jgi:molybdopterin-guanine dinucleotide biosynthesis protein A
MKGREEAVYHRPMGDTSPDSAAFILAGGKSTRMGKDKAFVTLDGRTLLVRALELARSVTPDVRIVGDPAKFAAFAPVVEDVFRGCGPLGGIHAALRASQSPLNLILAVDVPFVSREWLQYLTERARSSPVATVTIARAAGGVQPLCAVYRRQFAETAEQALQQGRYKIDALFAAAHTRVIEEEELEAAGFSSEMFRNLNIPAELEEARKVSAEISIAKSGELRAGS